MSEKRFRKNIKKSEKALKNRDHKALLEIMEEQIVIAQQWIDEHEEWDNRRRESQDKYRRKRQGDLNGENISGNAERP